MGANGRTGAQQGAQPKGSASGKEKGERRTCLQNQLHKTKFCMYHMRGMCQYGSECAFAHSDSELQGTPDLRKTRLCTVFMEGGGCKNAKCPFAHGEEELRSTDMFYKKTLCIWNEKGKCRNGDQCRFAHGSADLRANQAPVAVLEHPPGVASGGGRSGGRGGRKAAAGTKRAPATNSEQQEQAYTAEPMKIQPTRSLLDAPTPALKMQHFLPKGAIDAQVAEEVVVDQYQDYMKSEIERLRNVLSALTMKCSSMQQNIYPHNFTDIADSEAPAQLFLHSADTAWPAAPGFGQDDWLHFEQHGMGC
mmetsp:Transcript_40104/g.100721  ORF Transcript_40104/g.100721 Transcript_40104/m.100721 type:complete len:306 (-) Transcript_40104:124-1041(-)|eukprot:CAMPEP_0115309692 /NCGR_PEP_ID=MMETSP0270-20121206/74390_1 /TAXON_ID=71861 /ORGANISM="Scrippsiella trochoidea, Strain CCMP3099" /LENGTH=305 /DNA_ID=CAMNT_0002728379 /DNA_START=51 /DNA_END=968 /DNA_ORIENTATION=-